MTQHLLRKIFTIVSMLALTACGGGTNSEIDAVKKPVKATTILIYGDSISQGYGINVYGNYYEQINPGKTYADLLRQRIINERLDEFAPISVINASVGSEFSSDGLQRLPAVLSSIRPTHVILAHGTNDATANLPLSYISNNLIDMANLVTYYGVTPLIANVTFTVFGNDYANQYSEMIANTARLTNSANINLLSGILGNSTYYFIDGIHLNELAQPYMMNNVWNVLIPMLN